MRFDAQYRQLLEKIMTDGVEEENKRTGHKVKALSGVTIEVENEFPLLTLRKIPVKLFVAEQIWFISGSRRPDSYLKKYTKIWDSFTNYGGVVTAAYGYRWRHYFKRDQLGKLIELLEADNSSRHGVVSAWDPATDGLEVKQLRKNVPCPFIFVVNIIGDKLNMHSIVRSNDMILGCPHDVAGFALLQRFLAARLGVGVGKFTQSISHAHIYDIHYDVAEEMIERKAEHKVIDFELEEEDFMLAEQQSHELTQRIIKEIKNQYTPQPKLRKMDIVL